MQSRLMPWPALIAWCFVWLFGLWLAIVPAQAQNLLVKTFRTDVIVPPASVLRVAGAVWFGLLTYVFLFNLRALLHR